MTHGKITHINGSLKTQAVSASQFLLRTVAVAFANLKSVPQTTSNVLAVVDVQTFPRF